MRGSFFNYAPSLQPSTLLKLFTFADIIQEVLLGFTLV